MALQKVEVQEEGKTESQQARCSQPGTGLIPEHCVLRGAGADLALAQAQS